MIPAATIFIRFLLAVTTLVPPAVCAAPCEGCIDDVPANAHHESERATSESCFPGERCCPGDEAGLPRSDEPTSSEQSSHEPIRACGLTCPGCMGGRVPSVESAACIDAACVTVHSEVAGVVSTAPASPAPDSIFHPPRV